MNDPVLDLEISGSNANFAINPQRLRHSLLFSLLSGGKFPTANLTAEIDRISGWNSTNTKFFPMNLSYLFASMLMTTVSTN